MIPERKDIPATRYECLDETPAIALHKHGDDTIWSLAPSLSKVSLNPIDDIKNLQVLFHFRF